MGLYKWIWSHTIGRPFTYWRRDIYHLAPLVNIVLFVSAGFFTGIFFPLIIWWVRSEWYHLIIIFAVAWLIGVLQGHFYWGKQYIPNQPGDVKLPKA